MSSDPIGDINEAMEDAVAAQQVGDYTAALRHMETAFLRISVLPDSEFADERLQWDRERIQSLINYLQKRASAQSSDGSSRGTLIRPTLTQYERG